MLFLWEESPDGTVWPFNVIFSCLLFSFFFFFKLHMQCSLWRNATDSLPRAGRDCFLGAMAWWWDYLFILVFRVSLTEKASFFLNVSVPELSALQELLPPTIDLLSCFRMFFKYYRQQGAASKALLCLTMRHILKHHTHSLPSFFAAPDPYTYIVVGFMFLSFFKCLFLWLLPLLSHTSTTYKKTKVTLIHFSPEF